MNYDYVVGVPVMADTPTEAAEIIGTALGFDQNSINEIGGLTVQDKGLVLICRGCDERFHDMTAAQEHGVFIPGPDPSWCGEAGFDLAPEEML
jgi:hypothetical protein